MNQEELKSLIIEKIKIAIGCEANMIDLSNIFKLSEEPIVLDPREMAYLLVSLSKELEFEIEEKAIVEGKFVNLYGMVEYILEKQESGTMK